MSRGWKRFYIKNIFTLCGKYNKKKAQKILDAMNAEDVIFNRKKDPVTRRAYVRNYAHSILSEWLQSIEGHVEHQDYLTKRMSMVQANAAQDEMKEELRDEDVEVANIPDADEVPGVFSRAMSASLKIEQKRLSKTNPLGASLLSIKQKHLVDETVLSMVSIPADEGTWEKNFNKSKNHALERIFSTDREVRNGQLVKHLTPEIREQLARINKKSALDNTPTDVPRALVVEGAALSHLLGNDLLEEIFFAVASQCDSVIACRVSPKQKALLVNLVQNYVDPVPVTLAIGDGANDVGMIQEAHIGVGISGLEGQQAVNASDFSIAQFRFLEDLLLIHGRWNFSRMSRVILFSFYKNAVLAISLMVYASSNVFSGTPLFDQWVLSMFNFIAFFPILFLGMFDRDLEKDYVRKNPQVYAPGPNNEYITNRTILRWVSLVFIHTFLIYYTCMPCITRAGGMTSAFKGLMSKSDTDHPGDGEGGDLKVFGTTLYTVLMVVLCYKVLFESRSLVYGEFPACTCRKNVGEGYLNRLAYSWYGVTFGSFIFLLLALYGYEQIAKKMVDLIPFVMVATHMYNKRAVTWLLILVVPIIACGIDVAFKLFSNMFYPSQTQIHIEIQATKPTNKKNTVEEKIPHSLFVSN